MGYKQCIADHPTDQLLLAMCSLCVQLIHCKPKELHCTDLKPEYIVKDRYDHTMAAKSLNCVTVLSSEKS